MRNSALVITFLPESILYRLLLYYRSLYLLFLLSFFLSLSLSPFFLLIYWRLFLILLLFWRGRRWIFLDLARSLCPHHDVANQYKHFVVLKRLAHSLNPKVNITDLGVRNIVDVYLALFYCFFPEQLRLLTLQNLLDS